MVDVVPIFLDSKLEEVSCFFDERRRLSVVPRIWARLLKEVNKQVKVEVNGELVLSHHKKVVSDRAGTSRSLSQEQLIKTSLA